MKKVLFGFLLLATPVYADVEPLVSFPSSIEMKQGAILKWEDNKLENLTTVTIAETQAVESFGRWNAAFEGWTVDLGIAYDAGTLDTVALLLGRKLGNLDKYLPIAFPLKDKLEVTIYPIGVYADDVFDDMTVSGASGVGIIKFDITF